MAISQTGLGYAMGVNMDKRDEKIADLLVILKEVKDCEKMI